jgi:hypothetical protein
VDFPLGVDLLSLKQLLVEYPSGEDQAQTQFRCPRHMLEDVGAENLCPVICIREGEVRTLGERFRRLV